MVFDLKTVYSSGVVPGSGFANMQSKRCASTSPLMVMRLTPAASRWIELIADASSKYGLSMPRSFYAVRNPSKSWVWSAMDSGFGISPDGNVTPSALVTSNCFTFAGREMD